jgi:hypothetical protein
MTKYFVLRLLVVFEKVGLSLDLKNLIVRLLFVFNFAVQISTVMLLSSSPSMISSQLFLIDHVIVILGLRTAIYMLFIFQLASHIIPEFGIMLIWNVFVATIDAL